MLDIATDKVESEVPSTTDGVIESILFNVNDVVPVGGVIARIKTNAEDTVSSSPVITPSVKEPTSTETEQETVATVVSTTTSPSASSEFTPQTINGSSNRFYSPLVLNIAANEGISMTELEHIPGTGNEGRVTKKDIVHYVSERKSGVRGQKTEDRRQKSEASDLQQVSIIKESANALTTQNSQLTTYSGNVEIIEMDRMRKLIADHMVRSKHTSPHVTSFTEADVTNLVMWRDKVKKDFEKREGTRITFTPLFIEAIVKCIKKFPLINSSLDGDKIIVKKDINIGMATALQSGNLIVPVIKNADQ